MKRHRELKTVFIFAGEHSGDLHGSRLLSSLRKKLPKFQAFGVGGPLLRLEGLHTVLQMEKFAVMGLSDVIKALPRLIRQFYQVLNAILLQMPEVVILIDCPDFTLRLAKALRKRGYQGKIVHYIAPSVWAHSHGRAERLADTVDLLLTIYPFEKDYFSHTNLQVEYVGNPLRESIEKHAYSNSWRQVQGIPDGAVLISIFPGSRRGEIRRNLPVMLEAAKKLKNEYSDVAVAISCVDAEIKTLVEVIVGAKSDGIHMVPKKYSYEMMRDSRLALAKSGTVTLELALHSCPTVVVYNLTSLNRFFAKYVLKLNLSCYCIVNIIRGNQVFPELIKDGFSVENVHRHAKELYSQAEPRSSCLSGCKQVQDLLQSGKASDKAARKIRELLTCSKP